MEYRECECGRVLKSDTSIVLGKCWACRESEEESSVYQTPPHIDARIEVYAARVAAIQAGDRDAVPLFRDYERNIRDDYGWTAE